MAIIKLLDQATINQIAAGEVIDRPSSIVKELLENAIDACSTSVTVEIKDGGISFIRITDNGSGIAKDDIKTAFLRHSTSKIKNAVDLLSVSSLGFRGEALSSIAAVAQVELITKTKSSFVGTRYVIEGGEEKSIEDVGAPDGTTFIIRNLFYNTPARRKFLKSAKTEAGYISDIVERIAMSHPEVSIRFISGGQSKIHTSGNSKIKDVIYNIYGREITAELKEIDCKNDFMSIRGFVANPRVSRGNRTYENYFINGRFIKNNIVSKAIEEAYKPFMMQHQYPFTALYFEMNPELLDVNVHPSKMEIRFRNQQDIYSFIYESVTNVLRATELIRSETVPMPLGEIEISPILSMKKEGKNEEKKNEKKKESYAQPFEINRIKEQVIKEDRPVYNKSVVQVVKESAKEVVPKKPDREETPKQLSLFEDKLLSEKARPNHRIVGQVFGTYWIVEYNQNMYIIDQHAAHEKVLYERMMRALKEKEATSQRIAPPIIISLTSKEEDMVVSHMELFEKIGYEIEHFGGSEYAVRAVPDNLFSISKKELLINMIDNLAEDTAGVSNNDLILEKIASMSCKAAVKGNTVLSYREADELIYELLTLDNPYNCPHGRPTIISMSKYEIEKKFKRIV